MEPLISNPTTERLPLSTVQDLSMDCYSTFGQSESMPNNVNLQQCAMPKKEAGQPQVVQFNSGQMNMSMPNKRKATTELLADNGGPQKLCAPNRRGSQVGTFAKVTSATSASTSMSLRSNSSGRKVVQAEPLNSRSQSTGSKKNAQPQMSPKPLSGSYESVRTKLRESLAAALVLVSHQQEISLDVNKKGENDVSTVNQKGVGENKSLVSASSNGTANLEPGKFDEACTSSFPCPTDACNDDASGGINSEGICEETTQTWNYMDSDFQSNSVLSGEDVSFGNSFFFKDELLQENGLSWDANFNPHVPEIKQVEHSEQPKLLQEEVGSHGKEQTTQSPESVAFEIESELFKLFGGVNKKYKEKGRSLLFNLKDRNNPELRERVISGEIPPDRLCAMTAEELASKELSQWRIAKAEELDHMKVLPDSEANMRRLVKKTHKGEYQVDLDPDVGAVEDIPIGTREILQNQSKTNGNERGALPKPEQTKAVQGNQCEITIPSDGADMQGLMVDDVGDLPPILSFDEFMESLDKEPPFEDLPDGTSHDSNKEKSEVDSVSKSPEQPPRGSVDVRSERTEFMSPVQPSEHPAEISSERIMSVSPVQPSNRPTVEVTSEKTDGPFVERVEPDSGVRSADTQKGLNTSAVVHSQKGERVWEGLLQLNISSMVSFTALYKSGEKASTREWPGFFDIKGRVKLDAFDNFVQVLPMSRSRAIMVTHFVLKEGSTESEQASLQEVVKSYIMDQRLGFAEPAPGVELYLCAPRSKSVDVIISHLNKSFTDKLNDIDNGLIGLLVWRKVQITPSAISTNSSHHQKDIAKKIGSLNVENDLRTNVSFGSRNAPPPPIPSHPQPANNDDDDDDAPPPGFGPPGHRPDDDDLPEFNFSGSSNQQPVPHPSGHHHHLHSGPTSHKVEKMRELIQKYGQNGNNPSGVIPTQPWNDDDDDIPEWQPQPPPPALPTQNPILLPHMVNQPPLQRPLQHPVWSPVAQQMQPLQRPMSVHQQGAWWPYGTNNNLGSQPMMGRDWRPNASNNRGY